MGTQLKKCMDQLMEEPGMLSVVCADEQGLTISQKEAPNHKAISAAARDILELAKKLGHCRQTPTVTLKGSGSNITIAQDISVITILQRKNA
uniref:Late endosomal/lysosomal adaptor and MAPK and MTOR activator 5 n=1 Tax=Syphacia muris TaxID=451379 RepID=A0A0N5APK2_9BILA